MKTQVRKWVWGLALVVAGWVSAPLLAQQALDGTVTVEGSAVIKRQPEVLRVQVDLLAKGKDLKEALAKLKERREATRTLLAALNPVQGSVEFGEPVVTTGKSQRQRQMEMLVAQRLRARGKKAPPVTENAPVVVSASFKADLPLKAASPEDLLVVAAGLQDKIKALDLGGLKEFQRMSPQEEELAEEMTDMRDEMDRGEIKPGEPVFVYVAKISEEDRAKAMAEAYQKARLEAGRLARAAGAEVGALKHLQGQTVGAPGSEDSPSPYYARDYEYRMMLGRASRSADGEQSSTEAVGAQPVKVTFRVSVTAAFTLKPAVSK
jgi:uncharacterized protein YggE